MSSNIKLIKNEKNTISITNLSWDEYRHIMLAVETTRCVLDKEILDSVYYNQEKERLLLKMECLYINLQENGIPFKCIAESLDESIIKKCLSIKE